MQVTVYPHRCARPARRRTQTFPRLDHDRAVDPIPDRCDVFAKQHVAGAQRDAAPRVPGRIVWCRSMQGAEKTGEVGRGREFIDRGRHQRCFTGKPSGHAPRPGKSTSGSADANRVGNGQRQVRREDGEPALFVRDERSRRRTARQANRQLLAETEHPVIPPFVGVGKRKPRELGVLLSQQRSDEMDVNRRLRRWRHRSSVLFRRKTCRRNRAALLSLQLQFVRSPKMPSAVRRASNASAITRTDRAKARARERGGELEGRSLVSRASAAKRATRTERAGEAARE